MKTKRIKKHKNKQKQMVQSKKKEIYIKKMKRNKTRKNVK